MNLGKFLTHTLLLSLFASSPVANAEAQPVKTIINTAKTFLQEHFSADKNQVEINIGKVDPRLRLSKCSQPLSAFIPQGTDLKGNSIVGIRCVGVKSWHIYVPVSLVIKQNILVYNKTMAKGDRVSEADIEFKQVDISQLRHTPLIKKSQIVGSILKRRVLDGQTVNARNACMVCKGDKLMITTGNKRLSVSMAGTALEDGHYGERVLIENLQSKREISGTVVAEKKVTINL
jgi:flagella basal body P-ring formation protein FlgA